MGDRGKEQLVKQEAAEEGEIKRLFLGIMEGYNDGTIPPLSYFSHLSSFAEKGSSSSKGRRNEASWAKILLNDRRRRDVMAEKYSVLQSMLPSLCKTYKPTKEKIVTDTLNYIKYLEEEKERLEGLKKSQWKDTKSAKPFILKCPYQNSSENFTVSNGATFFAIELPFKRGLVPDIVKVLEKHKAEVLEARVSVDDRRMLTFTATIILGSDGGSMIDKIRQEILCL